MATVTVTDSATQIIGDNAKRQSLIIVNTGTETVYIGQTSSVTSANGVPLQQNATLTEDNGGTKMYCGPYYGITASSSSDVRVWERER
jgi:hypothetical protein